MTATPRNIVLDFLRSNRPTVAWAMLAQLLDNLLNVLLPLSIGLFYDIVMHAESAKGQMLKWIPVDSETGFFAFFGALIFFKALFSYLSAWQTGVLGERLSRDMRQRAFAAQMQYPLATFRERPVGKYLMRYTGDLSAIQRFVTRGLLGFAGDVFFMVCAFILLFGMQPVLALISLVFFVLTAFIIRVLSRHLEKENKSVRSLRSDLVDFVSSRLQAFYTVKSFNREHRETRLFSRKNSKAYQKSMRYLRLSAIVKALNPLSFFGAILAILLVIAHWVSTNPGAIARSEVLVFILLLLYMRGVMRRLQEAPVIWQSGRISLQKMAKLLNRPSETVSEDADEPAEPAQKKEVTLQIRELGFAYQEGKWLFENLHFDILPHQITMISGEGKSTFLKILQRMYQPGQGSVLLNGQDAAEMSPHDLRLSMAVVSDEAPLLGETVFEAITFRPDEDKRERAASILRRLHLSLAESEEETLDFPLEDNGRNLSAGEIALLQVARALMTRKPVLLLDDPFRHLDKTRRRRLVRVLNRLKQRHTIVLATDNQPRRLEVEQLIELQPDLKTDLNEPEDDPQNEI